MIAHLRRLLKEFHSYKAPGPDYLEADLFTALPDSVLQIIADNINDWIEAEQLDTEQLKARGASLFKKATSSRQTTTDSYPC